jgi:hypothetical protein
MSRFLSLKEYLSNPLQIKSHSLSKKDDLNFHWSDFAETCELYKKFLKKNKYKIYDGLMNSLEAFKNTDVWIKGEDHVHTLNLYTVYDVLVSSKKLPHLNKGKEDKVEISFMGPGGPFKKLTLGECVNEDTYSQFVFHRVLTGQLPFRDFRLRCKGKVLCYYDNLVEKSVVLEVSQLTSEGILFVSREKNLEKKLQKTSELRPLIDIKIFKDALNSSLMEMGNQFSNHSKELFFTQDDRSQYTIDPSKLKFFKGYDSEAKGIDYIFCKFEDIKGHNDLLEGILKDFTNEMKEQISFELKKAA